MPIFEYSCSACREQFELLHLSSSSEAVRCPACRSGKITRIFSTFAVTGRAAAHITGSAGCGGCTSTRGCASCSSASGRR